MSKLADLKARVEETINMADERHYFSASIKYQRALEAEIAQLRSCWASLTQLVALKDGPRDSIYYSERGSAWAGARKALAEYESPPKGNGSE